MRQLFPDSEFPIEMTFMRMEGGPSALPPRFFGVAAPAAADMGPIRSVGAAVMATSASAEPEGRFAPVRRVVTSSLVCAGVGAVAGVVLATLRRHPRRLYATRMGGNYFIISGVFFANRELFNSFDASSPIGNSMLAGAATGVVIGTSFGEHLDVRLPDWCRVAFPPRYARLSSASTPAPLVSPPALHVYHRWSTHGPDGRRTAGHGGLPG